MATPQQTSALPASSQLKDLADNLESAQRLYGSAKNYARMSIENAAEHARCVQAAKFLTGALRQIQALI